MGKETITRLNKTFEEYAYEQDGVEYWLARELQEDSVCRKFRLTATDGKN